MDQLKIASNSVSLLRTFPDTVADGRLGLPALPQAGEGMRLFPLDIMDAAITSHDFH